MKEMTAAYKKLSDVEWEDHFMTDKGKIRWIYTREKDESPITVMQIRLDKGVTLPDHVHRDQPDLIYVIEGKATMFIDGVGLFPVEPGMVIQVPPNTKHAIRNVEQDLLIYNVFAPAMKYMKGGK
jgi:quercetin dioxygenase-like cupin family protein